MREVITKLLKLQELEIVLRETRIVHGGRSLDAADELRERVERLRSGVPRETLKRFDRLLENGLAVARELQGVCSACRLNVPVGDLNRMRHGSISWECPNCGRFLLLEKTR